jgi:DNA-binding NarL/FixJ family response regulator
MAAPSVRILIADDHEIVRSGLRTFVEAHPRWTLVGEAVNGKEAVIKALQSKPDVAVLDYALPLKNGIEATREIRARLPATEVLIFTMYDSDAIIGELLAAGARGFLMKSDTEKYIVPAIDALAMHKPFFTSKVSEALLAAFIKRPEHTHFVLTPRERGVVQLVAEGYSNKQMAQLLNISVKTVETHRAVVMRKLGLNSSAALVRYAVRNKIIEA